jgi:hypothetical protein
MSHHVGRDNDAPWPFSLTSSKYPAILSTSLCVSTQSSYIPASSLLEPLLPALEGRKVLVTNLSPPLSSRIPFPHRLRLCPKMVSTAFRGPAQQPSHQPSTFPSSPTISSKMKVATSAALFLAAVASTASAITIKTPEDWKATYAPPLPLALSFPRC